MFHKRPMLKHKKTILVTISILITIFTNFTIYSILEKTDKKEKIANQISNLPEFYFYQPNTDSLFFNTDLELNKATLIIHFHPECEHCENEAKRIRKQIKEFESFQLVFVSNAESDQIISFANKHQLLDFSNIHFLEDRDFIFEDIFGKSGIPNSFIYNKQGDLVKQFKGEVKVEALLKYLNE